MQVELIELVLEYVALIHTDNDHEQHQVADKQSGIILKLFHFVCKWLVATEIESMQKLWLLQSPQNVQWYVMFIISGLAAAAALVIVGGQSVDEENAVIINM